MFRSVTVRAGAENTQNGNVKGLLAELMGIAPEEVQNALVEPLVEERGIFGSNCFKSNK